jgi:hypothetical protein
MDSELTMGHERESVTDVIEYNADGVEVFRLSERSTFLVIGVGPVDVPAGTFPAVEVLRTVERNPLDQAVFPSGASLHSPALHRASLGQSYSFAFRDAYAEGIGWIRRTNEHGTSVLVELEACGVNGVPTEALSWGAMKWQYKN